MEWLEVSLTLSGELAEAVAEVLSRFAAGRVAIENRGAGVAAGEEEAPAAADHAHPAEAVARPGGDVTVRAYLQVDAAIAETQRRIEEALWHLGRIEPLPAPVFTHIPDQDWAESWKALHKPIPIGRRLVIVPIWMESPDPGRVAVVVEPGAAFGTGSHPTTAMCLELLEGLVRPGEDVIDLGCGSGILAVAALKLGAGRALAVDNDPEAVAWARRTAEANAVGGRLILAAGSLAEILAGTFPFNRGQLVLANIRGPTLARLLSEGLGRLLAEGGSMILSGILGDEADAVAAAAGEQGLVLTDSRKTGDWMAQVFEHGG